MSTTNLIVASAATDRLNQSRFIDVVGAAFGGALPHILCTQAAGPSVLESSEMRPITQTPVHNPALVRKAMDALVARTEQTFTVNHIDKGSVVIAVINATETPESVETLELVVGRQLAKGHRVVLVGENAENTNGLDQVASRQNLEFHSQGRQIVAFGPGIDFDEAHDLVGVSSVNTGGSTDGLIAKLTVQLG